MSTDPLLDKMDALLKKHRVVEVPPAPAVFQTVPSAPPPLPDDAWLPVLTDVVALGEVNTTPAITAPSAPPPLPSIDPEAILAELEPRLSALIQGAVAEEIRNSLDNALATLLVQLDVHVREIVRETINEKLGK